MIWQKYDWFGGGEAIHLKPYGDPAFKHVHCMYSISFLALYLYLHSQQFLNIPEKISYRKTNLQHRNISIEPEGNS